MNRGAKVAVAIIVAIAVLGSLGVAAWMWFRRRRAEGETVAPVASQTTHPVNYAETSPPPSATPLYAQVAREVDSRELFVSGYPMSGQLAQILSNYYWKRFYQEMRRSHTPAVPAVPAVPAAPVAPAAPAVPALPVAPAAAVASAVPALPVAPAAAVAPAVPAAAVAPAVPVAPALPVAPAVPAVPAVPVAPVAAAAPVAPATIQRPSRATQMVDFMEDLRLETASLDKLGKR